MRSIDFGLQILAAKFETGSVGKQDRLRDQNRTGGRINDYIYKDKGGRQKCPPYPYGLSPR